MTFSARGQRAHTLRWQRKHDPGPLPHLGGSSSGTGAEEVVTLSGLLENCPGPDDTQTVQRAGAAQTRTAGWKGDDTVRRGMHGTQPATAL